MNVAVSEEQDWFSVHRWDAEGATWTYLVVKAKEAKEDEENEQHRDKAGKITVCPEFCISKEFFRNSVGWFKILPEFKDPSFGSVTSPMFT